MADTNRSLLGTSFDDFVSKQLKTRSDILSNSGSLYRTSSPNLEFLNYVGKNAFIRLSSGVNISDEISDKLFNGKFKGEELAKNFVLQGGTLKFQDNKSNLRGGFGETYTLGNSLSDELTKDGLSDFGLRPMAGIENLTINTRGRWGSLREANITIRAFNRAQYSIIEMLYLRPGYTILLEWGHVPYCVSDASGKLEVTNFVDTINLFKPGITRQDIYKEILQKQIKSEGNYDAFIGPVVNFTTTTNPDGSYTFNVKAISWGAVIESLRINASGVAPRSLQIVTNNIQPTNEDSINSVEKRPNGVQNSSSKLSTIFNEFLKFKSLAPATGSSQFISFDIGGKYGSVLSSYDQEPSSYSINNPPIPNPLDNYNYLEIINFNTQEPMIGLSGAHVYIPLGGLLSLISKNVIINDEKENIVNINFNKEENLCFSPEYHLSVNPEICLIKYEENDFALYNQGMDENIEILGSFNKELPPFKNKQIKNTGYTMNIMVNLEEALRTLQNQEKEDVYLHSFLTSLMNKISYALGGVNDFNVGVDEITNTVTIRDNQLLTEKKPQSISIINTMGLKSSVRDINITTQLSNKLSSMIAIGAQATGVSIGVDASALSEYNKGLTDRIFSRKKEKQEDTNNDNSLIEALDNSEVQREQLAKQVWANLESKINSNPLYSDLHRAIFEIYNNTTISEGAIANALNIYKDILLYNKAMNPITRGLSTIPFTFNIKMDGLSGIKFGQVFSIEPERLPKHWINPKTNLPELAFLVNKIDHEINNNTWLTTIGGQAVPYRLPSNKGGNMFSAISTPPTPTQFDQIVKDINTYVYLLEKLQEILSKKDTFGPRNKYLLSGVSIEGKFHPESMAASRIQILYGYKDANDPNNLTKAPGYYQVDGVTIKNILGNKINELSPKFRSTFDTQFDAFIRGILGKEYLFLYPDNIDSTAIDIYNRGTSHTKLVVKLTPFNPNGIVSPFKLTRESLFKDF
jgi:hypothetical protein